MRMARHCESVTAVAEHLADHSDMGWVNHPGPENVEDIVVDLDRAIDAAT
jgi:O-acetylhomoserine/O-acetylserine sulfhydrylase-like pyridoxal-dependent enzyme